MNLRDEDRTRLDLAVEKAEAHTSAEVVVGVRQRSGAYGDVTLVGGAVVGLLALVAVLFADFVELDPIEVVPLVLVCASVGSWVTWLIAPRLIGAKRRQAQVDEAALAAFARCGVHRTQKRTGLLVYLSSGERLARVLPDQGVIDAVPSDVRSEWRNTLATIAQAPKVEALASAIEALGQRAGAFLPRAADDVDELQSMPGSVSAVELS